VILMTYRINVRTILRGDQLSFRGVKSYEVINGFLTFTDEKTGKVKRFAVMNTEIDEEEAANEH